MAAFFALFAVCLVAACALACAINYFLQTGPWRALGYGLLAVAIFLIFLASGLWDGASNYDWGPLTPVFAIMLAAGFLSIKFGKRIWLWWKEKHKP